MRFKLALLVAGTAAAVVHAQLAFDPPVALGAGTMPRFVRAGDIDADGDLELVVAHEGSNDVRIWKNSGNGDWSLMTTLAPGLGAATSIVLAKLQLDAAPDIVVTFRDADLVAVWVNNGAFAFSPIATYPVAPGPVSAVAADFNNDLYLDLAVSCESGGVISFLPGLGTGAYGPRTDVATGSYPVSVDAADLNGDGLADAAVSNAGSGMLSILLNSSSTPGLLAVSSTHAVGQLCLGLVIADLGGGAPLDIAVANAAGNAVHPFIGNGAGGFTAAPPIPVGIGPTSIAAADFDGDQLTDLAVAEYGAGSVSILRRTGAATFAPSVIVPAASTPVNVMAADLDGDGDQDFATVDHQGAVALVNFQTLLGANAFGNVGAASGGPFENLLVNTSAGGRDRRVTVGINQPFTISVKQPPTNPAPADFVVVGQLGVPNPLADATVLPFGIGTICIRPCALFPAATDLFLLASSSGLPLCGSPILPSAPAPWSSAPILIPIPATATLQGVIVESAGVVRVTNGIVIRVQ